MKRLFCVSAIVFWCLAVVESLRVLVTGGAGFIGSHLVRALVSEGYVVRVLDNLSIGSIENIGDVYSAIEFIEGDVRDYGVVEEAVRGIDAVVHLAAVIDVVESFEKPDLYFEVNVRGTYNIAKASKSIDTFIFASSCAVYGDPVKIPIDEDHPLRPKSPYAASKIAGEVYIHVFSQINSYRPVVFRLFNVYGAKQSRAYTGVIIEFIKRISRGEPPIIFGDGSQTRDFVYVDDVVKAMINALRNKKACGIYNIGSGKATTINELAMTILRIMNREDLKPINMPPRPGDIKHSVADITKARKELGYNPTTTIEKGIKDIINKLYDKHIKNTSK